MKGILGVIPARGGSKAIPGKNIKQLCGKSLIQRAFESATASSVLERVILSTDDTSIAEHGRSLGLDVPFMRPSAFASDNSPMIDVAVHALNALRESEGYSPKAVMILQPTSPLRGSWHIEKAAALLEGYESVCSVIPLPQDLSPYYLMKIREDGCLDFFMQDGSLYTRRQDLPVAYRRDGTIFLTRTEVIIEQRSFYGKRCCPMLMNPRDVLNIDTADDWDEAERVFRERGG